MNNTPSVLQRILYLFVGLAVIWAAVKLLFLVLGAVSMLIQLALSVVVVLIVGYVVYALVKAATNSLK